MRALVLFMLVSAFSSAGQTPRQPSTMLGRLKPGDSLLIYQCVVIDPRGEQFAHDYADAGMNKPQTRTTRVVVTRTSSGFVSTWYGTAIRDFPNRKFSGLKIRERPYWQFTRERQVTLDSAAVSLINTLEKEGREAIEYDYPVTKYTRRQVIFRLGKDFRQLVIDKGQDLSSISGN